MINFINLFEIIIKADNYSIKLSHRKNFIKNNEH